MNKGQENPTFKKEFKLNDPVVIIIPQKLYRTPTNRDAIFAKDCELPLFYLHQDYKKNGFVIVSDGTINYSVNKKFVFPAE